MTDVNTNTTESTMTENTTPAIESLIYAMIDSRLANHDNDLSWKITTEVDNQLEGRQFTHTVERIIEDTDFSESIEEQVTNYMDNNVDIESVVQEELDRRIDDIDEKVNEALDARWDENDFDRRLENKITETVGDLDEKVASLIEAKLEEMLTRLFSRMISK